MRTGDAHCHENWHLIPSGKWASTRMPGLFHMTTLQSVHRDPVQATHRTLYGTDLTGELLKAQATSPQAGLPA